MSFREDFFLFESQRIKNPWHFSIMTTNFNYINEFDINENTVHWHDYFEIEIMLEGELIHKLNNKEYTYTRGDICILNYFDFHTHCFKDNIIAKGYSINFDDSIISNDVVNFLINQDRPIICHFEEEELCELIHDIEQLKKEKNIENNIFQISFMTTSFNKILLSILKKYSQCVNVEPNLSTITPFYNAISYIKCHFRENITLNQIAKNVGLTPNYLGLMIKEKYKKNYTDFLTDIRLKHAKNLLTHSFFSVEFIASNSGFTTPSYFISCFKKKYGLTPKQYQLNNRK